MSVAKSQRYSAIEYVAKAIWLGRYSRENIMGLLSAAYFDASGKEKGYLFLTVAGGASPVKKKWTRFERQWNAVLKSEGVREFHATDFAASRGEFKDWKGDKERRSRFLRQLLAVMKTNVNRLFSVTIELQVWRDVNREYLLVEAFHAPYALAGFSVVCQALNWAKRKRVRKPFELFFEEGDEGWGGLKNLCMRYNNIEPIRLPKEKAVAFQMGDLIAWKSRIAATNSVGRLKSMQEAQLAAFDD